MQSKARSVIRAVVGAILALLIGYIVWDWTTLNTEPAVKGLVVGMAVAALATMAHERVIRQLERRRIAKARALVRSRGCRLARYDPIYGKSAEIDTELATAMELVASEGEILLDRGSRIMGVFVPENRGPHLRLVVSND